MDAKKKLKAGIPVEIPVKIKPGAFLNERFVALESLAGTISGFVDADELFEISGDRGFIHGIVKEVKPHSVVVRINGSFFTTTGLAELSRDLVTQHSN